MKGGKLANEVSNKTRNPALSSLRLSSPAAYPLRMLRKCCVMVQSKRLLRVLNKKLKDATPGPQGRCWNVLAVRIRAASY